MTPREAMALGLPCVISNNSAHSVICDSGLVFDVSCPIDVPAYFNSFGQFCGNYKSFYLSELKNSLRKAYGSRFDSIKKAKHRREWARLSSYDSALLKQFESMLNPSKVYFSKKNIIGIDFIETNSYPLFEKLQKIKKILKN